MGLSVGTTWLRAECSKQRKRASRQSAHPRLLYVAVKKAQGNGVAGEKFESRSPRVKW